MRTPVESLRKGLRILELLCGSGRGGLSLGEIADRMGLKRNTTHNLLKTLCMCGYAVKVGKGIYSFGEQVGGLVRLLTSSVSVSVRMAEAVGQLAGALNETVVLTTLTGGRRCVLMRSTGHRAIQVNTTAVEGEDGQLWETPTGRALAAFCTSAELTALVADNGLPGPEWEGIGSHSELKRALTRIHAEGFAERHARDVASLAVPIMGSKDALLGAVGMHMPEYRWNTNVRTSSLSALRTAAPKLAALWGDTVTPR